MIDIRVDVDVMRDLTRGTILGQADVDRIIAVFRSPDFWQTSRIIWDYRAASLSELGQENLTRIAAAVRETDRSRKTRALAFVVRSEDAGLLMKLYAEISHVKFNREVTYHITTSADDALAWLDEHAPAEPLPKNGSDRRAC